jgi:hypothetical protein
VGDRGGSVQVKNSSRPVDGQLSAVQGVEAQGSCGHWGVDITFRREGRAGSRIIRMRATPEDTVSTVSDHGRRVTTTLSATSP